MTTTGPAAPRIGIVTISDRASRGIYADASGPALAAVLREYLATACEFEFRLIADERELIGATLRELAAAGCCLICTTGGTGPAPRDVTPEAIGDVCHKELPGFGEQMRAASLRAGVPTAILSRQTAAILDRCLVVTLPGKPASLRVCLDAVFPAIPYCIDLLGGPRLEGNPAVVQVFRPAGA
jgi:molybdopterin adenylyltransferase